MPAKPEKRWGGTEAYRQSEAKTAGYRKDDWARIDAGMDRLFRRFAEAMAFSPEEEAAQGLVREWQQYITQNYYECTGGILRGWESYTAQMNGMPKILNGMAKDLRNS